MKSSTAFLPLVDSGGKAARKQHLGNWGAYAAAAGAALAMSTSASAEIVYSGAEDKTVSVTPGGGTQKTAFTVAGLGGLLSVVNKTIVTAGPGHLTSHIGPALLATVGPNPKFFQHNSIKGATVAINYVLGQSINGVGAKASSAAILRQHFAPTGKSSDGAFGPGNVTGFVGFKTASGDFGWLEVQVNDSSSPGYPDEAAILGWAYDNSGAPIAAGDTGISPTPEPGTAALGLLAFGAAGVLALRKRRNELAAK